MTDGSIARRYARALLEIGRDEGLIERLGEDLATFAELARLDGGQIGDVMANPVFTHTERRAVLDQILPPLALHPMTANFLRLLLDKARMDALVDIVREYAALADTEAGRVRATVTTATELDPALREAVTAALAASTGKEIVLETRVDPSLLGGLVATVGSKVYDASLRTRLERLQLSLAAPVRA